jgi:ribosomal protein L16 Arg81 hydroxylase
MSKLYGYILAVALGVAALFFLGRSSKQLGIAEENIRIAEEQETIAVAFARRQTAAFDSVRQVNRQLERAIQKKRQESIHLLRSADSTAADAHQVLRDSAATVQQLRGALYVQVATTERLSAQFREYIAKDDSVHYSWGVERAAYNEYLVRNVAVLEAKDGLIRALRKANECKVLWLKCPTRTQTAIGTALLIGGITLARD